MADLLQGQIVLSSCADSTLDRVEGLHDIRNGITAIIFVFSVALFRLLRPHSQSRLSLYSLQHVLLNLFNVTASLICLSVKVSSAVQGCKRFHSAVIALAWSLVLTLRLSYFVSKAHRRTIHGIATSISLAVFIFDVVPSALIPLAAAHYDVNHIGHLDLVHLGSTLVTSVIIPLTTPSHDVPQGQAHAPSSKCSPVTRWWTYGWVSPLITAAYRSSGTINLDDLPALDEECHPEKWRVKFLNAHRKLLSTPRTLWNLFRYPILVMALFMIACGCAEFLGTVGLTNILRHLGTGSQETFLRPWFAALLFGISPIVRGLCMQTYEFHSTKNICYLKSIIISTLYQKLLNQQPNKRLDAGRVTSLVAADIDKVATLRYTLMAAFLVPTEVAVASVLLYRTIGWSYIPGLAVIILTRIPISWLIGRYQEIAQSRVMGAIDARVRRVTEAIKGLQTVKVLGLESAFGTWVDDLRKKEVDALWHKLIVINASDAVSGTFVLVPLVLSLGLYTLVGGHPLTPDVVFTVVAIFNTLKSMMALAVVGVGTYAQAIVSLARISAFMDEDTGRAMQPDPESVGFSWSPFFDEPGETTESPFGALNATICLDLSFKDTAPIFENISFKLVPGGINVITGELGTGKSTLIKALLNEIPVTRGSIGCRRFPEEAISYAGQVPWLKGRTVREATLFNAPFSKARYEEVIQAVGMDIDLQSIQGGDLADLGTNCAALSGGQKARVALARAIYAETKTIVLDDILAALDMTTTTFIVERCLLGPLMRGRTVMLVTSNPRCIQVADLIINVADGKVIATEQFNLELESSQKLPQLRIESVEITVETDCMSSESDTLAAEPSPLPSKVVFQAADERQNSDPTTEAVLQGLIGKLYAFKYISLFGPWWFLALLCAVVLSVQAVDLFMSFWLTVWSGATEHVTPAHSPAWYLLIYGGLGGFQLALAALASLVFFGGALRASRVKHRQLVASVLGATFTWITATPAGQILNRFSADMFSLDNTVTELLKQVVDNFLAITFRLVAISSVLPTFLAPALLLLILGMFTGQVYLYGSTASKRIYAARMSPLLGDIADSISGIEVIRAYQVQHFCRQRFIQSLEAYLRGWEAVSACQRWFAVRMDTLAGLISLSTAVLALRTVNVTPEVVGFSLTSSVTLCSALLYAVYVSSLLEVEMSSFQRIEEYIHHTPQEQQVTNTAPLSLAPTNWPAHGQVKLHRVTASYSEDSVPVLWDVDLCVKPGTRVAIVGRSGSGKSSLAATLLRLTHKLRGEIEIDGIDVNQVDLFTLRRKVTFIPQDPTLFAGNIRQNIDFLGERTDAILQSLLDAVMGGPKDTWTLGRMVEANGANLSQGERQLVAMVRALASDSRILIIDEATANLDPESESRIQRVLKERFRDRTVIAIAHKLSTVLDFDQVVVLDQGKVVEEGDPMMLIESGRGHFWRLWQDHGVNS